MVRQSAPAGLLPVEEFCNSAKHLYGEDELSSLDSGRRWLAQHGYADADAVTETDLSALRRARELIRSFVAHRDDEGAREGLNELLREVVGHPVIDGPGALTFARVTDGAVTAVLHPVLAALVTTALTGGDTRLKVCAAPECRWVYFDHSPAAAGLWCDMNICGARHKMRAYRARGATRTH